jgi:hypothetical protein
MVICVKKTNRFYIAEAFLLKVHTTVHHNEGSHARALELGKMKHIKKNIDSICINSQL